MIRRCLVKERPEWRRKNAAVGFDFDIVDGTAYWSEATCYELTLAQAETLENATAELHELCLELVDRIVAERWFDRLQIAPWFADVITRSWQRGDRSLYGRFDLAYDGVTAPKLLEYNADTPTSLLESSIVQWKWLEEQSSQLPHNDQFNSIHERLIAGWQSLVAADDASKLVHFAYLDCSLEDYRNVEYLMDTAAQAGLDVQAIPVEKIGTDGKFFYDLKHRKITRLFKLYPYEWMLEERYAAVLANDPCQLFEPPWKSILSNKTAMALLWELFPGHENLLPAMVEGSWNCASVDKWPNGFVRKPLYGREGANVQLRAPSLQFEKDGPYGFEGFLLQGYAPLLERDGNYAIFGSWVIADEPAGICIREDQVPIMSNLSRFCPHYFVP